MLKTVLIIVISVAIFGVIFFLIIKRSLKKQLNYYLIKDKNKKKRKDKLDHFTEL